MKRASAIKNPQLAMGSCKYTTKLEKTEVFQSLIEMRDTKDIGVGAMHSILNNNEQKV